MEGRRVTVSPRPCSGRRVAAARKHLRGEAEVNSVRKLLRREIGCARGLCTSAAEERFRNIHLQEEFDTHDPKGHCSSQLLFLRRSPGIMLLIFTRASSYVPLKILSIEDGRVLKSFKFLLHRNKKVDFIEQFNEKLLVKQEDENLQILDVRKFHLEENRMVAVWNFRGELVTSFEDHLLWHSDSNTNNI